MADKRHTKHQRLLGKLLQPALFTEPGRCQTTVEEPSRLAVDQSLHTEFLGETLQLSGGGGSLLEIDEVSLDPALGEESKGLTGIRAFLYAEDLDFHGAEL